MLILLPALAILTWVGWTVAQDYAAATGTPSERLLGAFRHTATLLYARLGAVGAVVFSILVSAADSIGAPGLTTFLSRWMTPETTGIAVAVILAAVAWLRTQSFGFEDKAPD